LTEGQKAVLANEYMKSLIAEQQSEAGKKTIEVRYHPEQKYGEDTVTSAYNEEQERSRKIAADRLKVAEKRSE
jgi:hypothetical protein